jgi:putative hydrolase
VLTLEFIGDFHMHSTYSDGRYSLEEMVVAGRKQGLKSMAITDHGPNNIRTGVKNPQTFLEIKEKLSEINQKYPDMQLLCGCEADIIGLNGEIDVPPEICEQLDILVVGLHPFARPGKISDAWSLNLRNQAARVSKGQREKVKNSNTKTLLAAMENQPIDTISHPGLGMPISVPEVARGCAKHQVLYEVNCGHTFPNLEDILAAAKEGVDFIVDSDAHFTDSVGKLDYGSNLLEQAGVPIERIANAHLEGKNYMWEK